MEKMQPDIPPELRKSPALPTWTEKELNLGTVDDYTLSLLDSLGVMLASSPKGLHVVDLLSSCSLAAFQKEPAGASKWDVLFKFIGDPKRLIAIKNNEVRLLAPDAQGAIPLGSLTKAVDPQQMTFELSYYEMCELARTLHTLDLSSVNPEFASFVTQIIKESQKIRQFPSNRHFPWNTLVFRVPFAAVAPVYAAILPTIPEPQRSPAAYALLERFRMFAQTVKDTQSYSVESSPGTMKDSNCEVVRLRSFAEWPRVEPDFYATPQKLARVGFYYDPKPVPLPTGQLSGIDRCVCYSCQLPLVNLEANDDPWEEHSQQSPVCKFVQGRDPSNIPLSVTLNASPSKRHGAESQTVVTIAAVQDAPLVATGSADGLVVFWDISLELKQLHSFNALRDSTWIDAKNPASASNIVLSHLLFVPCKPTASNSLSARGNEKWAGWCTVGVQVEVTDKLYAGAKGVVFDILGDDLICVYVTGLNEVMTFSLAQIRACRPKANQRCKILTGPHKGDIGLLVSASGNQGFVRVYRTKQIVGIEFEALSWISDEAAASIESELLSSNAAPDCCLLTIFTSQSFGLSLLTLFQYSRNSTKFMQALSCDYGLVTAAEYLPTRNRILALCKQSDGGFALASFAYDPSGRRLSPLACAPLKLKPGDDFIPNVARWESDNSIVVMTTRGQVLILNSDNLQLLSTAQIGGEETKREYTDFEVSEREQQLSCISKAGTLHQLSLSSPAPLPVDVKSLTTLPTSFDGATTLANLIAIKETDVERLRFFSYASPSAKQTLLSEKEGTLVKWIMIPTELSRVPEVHFELELPQVGLVDRIDMLIGYTGLDPEEKEDWPKCTLAVSYSMGDAKWQKLLDKIDLFSLAMCNTDQSLNEYDQSVTESAISISTQVTARRMLLTITVQSPAASPRTPTGLRTLSASLYGYSTRTKPSLLNYTKRLALFSSSDFPLSLLRLVQQSTTTVDLRNVALDLLWAEYASKEERTSFLIGHTDLHAYLKNIIYFGSTTSKKAARLLLRMAQVSTEFSTKCLDVCLELLPSAVASSVSHGCLQQLVGLISQCWSSAPEKAHKVCTKELLQLGEMLSKSRNPLYNILQTHYGLYGFPLEPDVFEAKPVMGKLNNEMEGDELQFKFNETSSNASGDSKKRRMRFTKVQRSGNWFVVDLGTTCLVTELVIDYTFDHQSTWGYVTVETALDNIQDVQSTSRLASEKLGGAKRGGKKLLTMRRLNRMCRFLKFDVKLSSMRPGDQGISFVLDIFGIQDYIALTLPSDVLIPKLESVILSSEEKRHKTAADFAQRRRVLCAKLEEISLSGDAYTNHVKDVSTMFYNCMQAQLEFHWLNRRVVRLRGLQASFLPGVAASSLQASANAQLDDRLDRWSSAAELLVSCLVTKEEDLHNTDTLRQLFDYFLVYSTPALREKTSDLISYQLERWPSFASDVLAKYFSSTSSASDATLFPQQEVFQLALRTLRDQQHRKPFTDDLFSYLHRLTEKASALSKMPSSENAAISVDQPRSIDMTLSSWLLLLLSQVMSDEVTSTDTVHEGVKCRGCGMCPIRGVRYSCVNCISYDLCEKCESESKHIKWHIFLKVPQAVEPPETYTPDASVAPLEEPLLPVLYPQGFEDEPSVSASAKLSSAMIACASCGQTPISHPHFKCACCDDYHLCAQCEGLVEHTPTHLFLKVNIPVQHNVVEHILWGELTNQLLKHATTK